MITIIHLSDLHIKSNGPVQSHVSEAIKKAAISQCSPTDVKIIVITGDIAFSGNANEYELAKKFVSELCNGELESASVITCPGNHDNDFSQDDSVRLSVLKDAVTTCAITGEQIDACLKIQANYARFKQEIENLQTYRCGKLTTLYNIHDKHKDVFINSINSAYCCQRHCETGSIFVPEEVFCMDVLGPDYKIAIMHHTPNWFLSQKQRELRAALNKNYDLILTGHEHEYGQYNLSLPEHMVTQFVEGGCISPDGKEASFNLIRIDTAKDLINTINFVYDANILIFRESSQTGWKEILSTKYSRQYGDLDKGFIDFLDDPGASFPHPRKDRLTLQDVYIFPNLSESNLRDNKNILASIQSINARKIISKQLGKTIIAGADKSGKTSLAKMIFSELNALNMIPVYIDCQELSKTKTKDIDILMLEKYKEQYLKIDIDIFKQSRHALVVPVIDNFHLSKLNNLEKIQVLHKINDSYSNFLVFVDDLFRIENLASLEGECENFLEKTISKMNCYSIMTFGYALRGDLIKKWLNISDSQIDMDIDDAKLYDDYSRKLTQIVENNYVPPYPIIRADCHARLGILGGGTQG